MYPNPARDKYECRSPVEDGVCYLRTASLVRLVAGDLLGQTIQSSKQPSCTPRMRPSILPEKRRYALDLLSTREGSIRDRPIVLDKCWKRPSGGFYALGETIWVGRCWNGPSDDNEAG